MSCTSTWRAQLSSDQRAKYRASRPITAWLRCYSLPPLYWSSWAFQFSRALQFGVQLPVRSLVQLSSAAAERAARL